MGVLTVVMFVGITALAVVSKVHVAADASQLVAAPAGYEQRTVIAQVAGAVFGLDSVGFYAVQAFTAAVLVMAANTAFNGFPVLTSILARDGFMPHQMSRRGDRLVFSNGVVILAALSMVLIVAFDASTTRLIQLYIIGVFISFTLSQVGMVRHWRDVLRVTPDLSDRRRVHRARAINALGAATTTLVLGIVLATKFVHGAWIVVIAMPVVYLAMSAVRRHYDGVAARVKADPGGVALPSRVHAIVLVSEVHLPTLRALAFAKATHPDSLRAVSVRTDPEETDRLLQQWEDREIGIPLTVINSPYRGLTAPVIEHIRGVRASGPRDVVAVFIPELVVGHWWENLLHNQSALRLKARLLVEPGVMVTNVPWQLGSGDAERPEPVGR
jgi:hypothetical protein